MRSGCTGAARRQAGQCRPAYAPAGRIGDWSRVGRNSAADEVRPGSRRRRLNTALALLVVLAAAAAATFVVGAGPSPLADAAPRAPLPPLEDDPGLVHLHGLGVDPDDGVLYAATHSGLFRVPEQAAPQRVANRAQDTMGFTVTGDGTFLASGHPDYREDGDLRPPLLGLLRSRDVGQTWQRLSLRGEADFHALQAAHGQVYGYDSTSQTFMVSRDGRRWERRARLLMEAVAVSPDDPEVVVATSDQRVLRSADGGRTWAATAGAPDLLVLTWAPDGQLYGVSPDGAVQRSDDAGSSWTPIGSVGVEPEAAAVDARGDRALLYVAARDRGILVSADGGRSFTTRYAP